MSKFKKKLLPIFILFLAASLRLININWDQGHFLHPDERFLNMTIKELEIPNSLSEYFDPQLSRLNPRNHERSFFVYGNLAPSLNKLVTSLLKQDSLEEITITGRLLSALADLLVIPIIYLTVLLLEKNLKDKKLKIDPNTKFWAIFIYALSVLPIQQAHFFTTDTFLNLFVFASFYFSLQFFFKRKLCWLIASGIFSGLAISSKISGVFILPLNLSLLALSYFWPIKKQFAKQSYKKNLIKIFRIIFIFFISTYLSLRISSPYIFENTSFFQINLANNFINNLKELRSLEGNEVWFPPAIQWIDRSRFFGLKNLVFFGFGLVASMLAIKGITLSIKKIILSFKKPKLEAELLALTLVLFWLFCFLTYYSQQFVQSIRYYLIVYPFLAIFAGFGVSNFLKERANKLLYTTILIFTLSIWPLMFISIYIKPHSRIQASEWIYENIPSRNLLITEHWDDTLPIKKDYSQYYENQELAVFSPDNESKWLEMQSILSKADYYILSSNRAWGSIIRLPEKYPQMSKFYQDLLSGKGNFKLVAQFKSHPSLEYLGIPISFNDSWADEAFTVYDHPEVLIFKRISN